MDLRELAQQLHHPVVILECMEPDPGKAILARDHVFVERLVHVPQEHQPNLRGTVMTHSVSFSRPSVSGRRAGLEPEQTTDLTVSINSSARFPAVKIPDSSATVR